MENPFPGMNPYLEQYWRDVHQRLIVYACDQLQGELPSGLRARIEERVYVESQEGDYRVVYPDIHIVERPRPERTAVRSESGVAVAEPLVIHLKREPVRQGYLEIIDVGSGNRVLTVVEFVSPSNKAPGEGQELYLRKQQDVLDAGASLVEIDLTRSGHRVFAVASELIPPSHRTAYQACVCRGWKPDLAEVYRLPLTERLPAIPVPLRPTDADARLDLQALIDQCYRNGRYDDLDYRAPLAPPLDPADAAWANELLRSRQLR